MPDQTITITVPEAKVSTFVEGFLKIYPNTEPAVYTTPQWIREKIRRNVIRDVLRGLELKAREESQVEEDNGLIT